MEMLKQPTSLTTFKQHSLEINPVQAKKNRGTFFIIISPMVTPVKSELQRRVSVHGGQIGSPRLKKAKSYWIDNVHVDTCSESHQMNF